MSSAALKLCHCPQQQAFLYNLYISTTTNELTFTMQLLILASSLAKKKKKTIWRNTCIWLHLNAVDNSGQRQRGNRQITICPMCCGGGRTFLIFHEHCHFPLFLCVAPTLLPVYIVLWLLIWVEEVEFLYTCWSYFSFVIKGLKWKSCIAFDGNENNGNRLSYGSRESYCAEQKDRLGLTYVGGKLHS